MATFLSSCFLTDFLLLSCIILVYYSRVCFFLLLHPGCSHVRGILCGIHTPCMGSLFPIVCAELSLIVFLSFWIMLSRWVRTALNSYNNNNNSLPPNPPPSPPRLRQTTKTARTPCSVTQQGHTTCLCTCGAPRPCTSYQGYCWTHTPGIGHTLRRSCLLPRVGQVRYGVLAVARLGKVRYGVLAVARLVKVRYWVLIVARLGKVRLATMF